MGQATQQMDVKVAGASNQHLVEEDGLKEIGSTEPLIDPAKEKILLAKLDLFFTPIIMLVYLSCFLDRTNIVCSASGPEGELWC